MNSSTSRAVRAYLKMHGIDIHTRQGKRIYRNVKRELSNNKVKAIVAGKEEE